MSRPPGSAGRRVGLAWHELFAWHDIGSVSAHLPAGGPLEPDVPGDSGARVRRIRGLLEVSGLLEQLEPLAPRPADDHELLTIHTPGYLAHLDELARAGGGDAGEMAPMGADSARIARLAAGACLVCVEHVMAGAVDAAYALVRPPGHHAERDRGRGFCLLANVAVAAAHARANAGADRVAIIDWDVHHGNGTQQAFWDDRSVLTISLHQERSFPTDSGTIHERGGTGAYGLNVNVPLPPGCGTAAYLCALERVVVPAVRTFEPDLLLVSCGLDAGALDPYGRMLVHSDGFRSMTAVVRGLADEVCHGRLVFCHEGGYSTAYAPLCGLAVLEELAGVRTAVRDPFLAELVAGAGQPLADHQEQAVEAARAAAPLLSAITT